MREARLRRLVLGIAATLVLAAPAVAAPSGRPLPFRLDRALAAPGVSRSLTGAIVVDLTTGFVVYQRNEDESLQPASTEKLAVSFVALSELGPNYRTETQVLGEGVLRGGVWDGDVFLKGFGDPGLDGRDLARLARQVRALGIRRVTGSVVGDESYFDRRRTAPGWKPSFYRTESPPLSALVVDRAVDGDRVVERPALAAARAFDRALERAGVNVARRPGVGVPDDPLAVAVLGRVASAKLAAMVEDMNTESDNFTAETVLKLLAAEETGLGTSARGAVIVRRVLREHDVPLGGMRIVDGSGLSRLDRLTAISLVELLSAARDDPAIARAFLDSLAVAGVSGTLQDRMETGPARGAVRAKTGTTSAASALAGFAGDRYAFAILMNGSPVATTAARTAQDRFATILARSASASQ
jgi:D-alanyl-D-alanine carboxypeptidase/D-alanyl-D-alanine-endopeptidase (penicillin-binding protein 4)